MKLLRICILLSLGIVLLQCQNENEKNMEKEVWTGKAEGFPMFFKKGEKIIGIPCHDVKLITKGQHNHVDSVFIEFGLTLVRIEKLNRAIDYFSGIDFPEHEDGFFTTVRFKVHGNELLCKQLSEEYAKSDGKNPIDILLYREIPNVPYYRKIVNYEIKEWTVFKTPY